MLQIRPVEEKKFSDYKRFLSKKNYSEIKNLAKKLKGKKIVHLNATPVGGGVVTTLRGLVPLEESVGLKSSWYVINAPLDFFAITKKIHNGLQGNGKNLADSEKKYYLEINKKIAKELQKIPADIYIMHDPQPLASINFFTKKTARFILRIHIDLSAPNKDTLSFLMPHMKQYDKIIFMLDEFVPKGLTKKDYEIILNAIDPLDVINKPLPPEEIRTIMTQLYVHLDRPIISQSARFDPWKDPVGVIQAYYIAKNKIPDLQLILANISEAADDPEAKAVFKIVKKHAKGDPGIFLFSTPESVGNIASGVLTNAIQSSSDIVLAKSTKEGFGLIVSEGMWKAKPVIGGNAGGIKKQIINGKTGFLVSSPEEAAKIIVRLMRNKPLREKMGKAARQRVKKNFLVTRHLRDHLKLYAKILRE